MGYGASNEISRLETFFSHLIKQLANAGMDVDHGIGVAISIAALERR